MDLEPNKLREEEVIPLIVSQLAEYGYSQLAQMVAEQAGTSGLNIAPSSRLSEMLYIARDESEEILPTDQSAVSGAGSKSRNGSRTRDVDMSAEGETVTLTKLSWDTDPKTTPRPGPNFTTCYTTTHKSAVHCVTFSNDGKYVASGSADTSLKILDVAKMKQMNDDVHPVIRTLYDHLTPVTDVDFHPNGLVLAASSDTTIKLYDLSKPSVKRSFRYLQDTHNVNSLSFHPSGDFLLVGTESEMVKIYDVKTLQCYSPKGLSSSSPENKNGLTGIQHIEYAGHGAIFVTASADGSIKIWDAVSGKIVRSIDKAHSGQAVSSATISKNGKYILSGGRDSVVKLWDIGSGQMIQSYIGAVHQQSQEKQKAVFNYNEDLVMTTDESNHAIVCWDSRTGQVVKRVVGGHHGLIKSIAASPVENSIATGSADCRVKFWTDGNEFDEA